MDLGLNEAQQMLKNSAQEILEAECSKDYVREMEEDERVRELESQLCCMREEKEEREKKEKDE